MRAFSPRVIGPQPSSQNRPHYGIRTIRKSAPRRSKRPSSRFAAWSAKSPSSPRATWRPEEFYAAFLQTRGAGAGGGRRGDVDPRRRPKPQLAYQINLSQKLLDKESEEAGKHYQLLDYIVASNTAQLVPPLSSCRRRADGRQSDAAAARHSSAGPRQPGRRADRNLPAGRHAAGNAARLSAVPQADVRAGGRVVQEPQAPRPRRPQLAVGPGRSVLAARCTKASTFAKRATRSSTKAAGCSGCDRVTVAILKRRQLHGRSGQRPGHARQPQQRRHAARQAGDAGRQVGRAAVVRRLDRGPAAADRAGDRRIRRSVVHQVAGRHSAPQAASRPMRRRNGRRHAVEERAAHRARSSAR